MVAHERHVYVFHDASSEVCAVCGAVREVRLHTEDDERFVPKTLPEPAERGGDGRVTLKKIVNNLKYHYPGFCWVVFRLGKGGWQITCNTEDGRYSAGHEVADIEFNMTFVPWLKQLKNIGRDLVDDVMKMGGTDSCDKLAADMLTECKKSLKNWRDNYSADDVGAYLADVDWKLRIDWCQYMCAFKVMLTTETSYIGAEVQWILHNDVKDLYDKRYRFLDVICRMARIYWYANLKP